jgi:cellobiose phosphorylase
LCEAKQDEVISFIENIRNHKINPFEKGYVTNVEGENVLTQKTENQKYIFKGINPENKKQLF